MNLHIHSYKQFSEEVSIFDEMMELYLEPLDEITKCWHFDESRSPTMLLLARIFNDCESTRLLLLNGLSEQAVMPMRDIIESMMLFRLFGCDSKLALRWMNNLKEYQHSMVKKRLDELEIDCPESAFYGMLSEMVHPNLLPAAMKVTEQLQTNDLLVQTYYFGGMNKPSWIGIVFNDLLILMLMTLMSVVPPTYFPSMNNPDGWWSKVLTMKDRLVNLGADIQIQAIEKTGKDKIEQEQVFRKLKIDHIKLKLLDMEKIASDPGFPV